MSEQNFKEISNQTPEQAGQLLEQHNQMHAQKVTSVSETEESVSSSTGEQNPDEMEQPFQDSTKQDAPETASDREARSVSEDSAEQPLKLNSETTGQEPEIQQHPKSVEPVDREDSLSPELTLASRSQAPQETLSNQPSQLSSSVSEKQPESKSKSESIKSPQLSSLTTSEKVIPQQSAHSIASSSKWAPLIYGRTYAVDFRFLAVPHDFNERITNDIWEFIKVTTRSAENLSSKHRWIFLRTNRHCIIGVTCLIRDLLPSDKDNVSEDLTRDRHGRPLYAFVGFVSKTLVPSVVPAMNLALFAAPYLELIPQKWDESYAEVGNLQGVSHSLKTEYNKQFSLEEGIAADRTRPEIPFEQLMPFNQDAIVLWNIADTQNILFSASRSAQSIYLCTGNLTLRELLDSHFMSAVLEEIQSRMEVQKVQKAPPSQFQTSLQSQPQQDSRSLQSGRQGTYPRSREHPQHRGQERQHSRDSGLGRSRRAPKDLKDLIVGLSKFGRNNFQSLVGEKKTRYVDNAMFNTLGLLGRVFWTEAEVAEMYCQIASLDEFQYQLIDAIDATTVELKQLTAEYNELRAKGRISEADGVAKYIEKLNNKLDDFDRKLQEITHLLETRLSTASEEKSIEQSEGYRIAQQRDPYLGFKEKEKPTDEQPPEPKDDVSKSQDPWQL